MITKLITLLGLSAILSVGFSVITGQQKPGAITADAKAKDQEEEFAKKFEKQERALKVTIQGKNQYRMGEDVMLDLCLTNTSDEALGTSTGMVRLSQVRIKSILAIASG